MSTFNRRILHFIFHFISYYVSWFACILLAAQQHGNYALGIVMGVVTLQILWQFFIAKRTQNLGLMVGLFMFVGTLIDTVLMRFGLISFASNPFVGVLSPPWMISLWISFSVTIYALLAVFYQRSIYILFSFLSLIFFPFAYVAGVMLNAAQLPYGYLSSIIIGIIWAILFPICLKISWGHGSLLKQLLSPFT